MAIKLSKKQIPKSTQKALKQIKDDETDAHNILPKNLDDRYSGEYVAYRDGKVLAHDKDLLAVDKKARQKVNIPLFIKVPEGDINIFTQGEKCGTLFQN